jgi:NTE family protein
MENLPQQRASTELTRPPRIGLALGGGGARGLAHILVLEVFDELGVKPSRIAGTSIGAIFGAAYAAGASAAQIRAFTEEALTNRFDLVRQIFTARSAPVQRLLNVLPLRSALLEPRALLDIILPPDIPDTFEALNIPLNIVATDVGRREPVVFDTGDLKTAIAASIAIPVVFSPVAIGDRTLADGGLVNPLPYDLLRPDCDIIVAIDVSGAASEAVIGPRPGAMTMLAQSVQIMQKRLIRERLRFDQPDIYVDVQLDRFGAFQFHKVHDILDDAQPAKADIKHKLTRILTSTPG